MKFFKKISVLISSVILACNAAGYTSYAIEDPVLESYYKELGSETDRFSFWNYGYSVKDKNDVYYQNYLKHCSNFELANNPFRLFSNVGNGYCVGMAIPSIFVHNKVFTPSDIQADSENLIDIQLDDSVLDIILSYQNRQNKLDFMLYRHWNLLHHTKEEKVDILLDKAKKATEQGRYFLIIFNLGYYGTAHGVTGMGMIDGEWELNGEKYDKCVLTYDSIDGDGFIFINSETKKTYNGYPEVNENYFILDDDDFMNYGGAINPADSYETDVSSINAIQIISNQDKNVLNRATLTVTGNDGIKYDGIADCNNDLNTSNTYFCKGTDFEVQNITNEEFFTVNFSNVNNSINSDFNGAVNSVFKNETEFRFDTSGTTEYDLKFAFEEGQYNFTPHYRFDFSGVTDSDFKAFQTDRGIILSSSDNVKCQVKTTDVNRDENGLVVNAEENVQEDAVSTVGNVLLTFDENGSLKYYIGENYDTEVQKGDVNCDGLIDAVDASLILEAYSASSVEMPSYIGKTLGDYNNDGFVDSVDATGILAKYAELSTSN